MKNTLLYLILTLLLVTSCGADDTINQECYTCENTLTEYCIAEGADFYTVSVNGGATTNIPLNGQYWSDIKIELENECINGPQIDCFTCNATDTEYCYLPGDDFYTSKVGAALAIQVPLDGQTWAEVRSTLLSDCANG